MRNLGSSDPQSADGALVTGSQTSSSSEEQVDEDNQKEEAEASAPVISNARTHIVAPAAD